METVKGTLPSERGGGVQQVGGVLVCFPVRREKKPNTKGMVDQKEKERTIPRREGLSSKIKLQGGNQSWLRGGAFQQVGKRGP